LHDQLANIAQLVNVLQAMTLTEGDKMLLTPTYQRGVLTLSAGAN